MYKYGVAYIQTIAEPTEKEGVFNIQEYMLPSNATIIAESEEKARETAFVLEETMHNGQFFFPSNPVVLGRLIDTQEN